MRILVVEDEADLADALAVSLRRSGYACDIADSVAAARERLEFVNYDLLTLDLSLGDGDGRDLCRWIRSNPELGLTDDGRPVRVLMLTARDAVDERVAGLDDGADDYLVKPFSLKELDARVRVLLRRDAVASTTLIIGDLSLDTANHSVTVGSEPVALTAKEFSLLRYFATHPGQVLSQERLLEHVWDEMADPFTNTVRVTVGTLRRKLTQVARTAGVDSNLIETVIGAGYRLRDPGSP